MPYVGTDVVVVVGGGCVRVRLLAGVVEPIRLPQSIFRLPSCSPPYNHRMPLFLAVCGTAVGKFGNTTGLGACYNCPGGFLYPSGTGLQSAAQCPVSNPCPGG
jgi:hypothetical protein